jgi:DNA-3-methyladenine glycosylase I
VDDGLTRCDWATSAPDYVAYHDEEWGAPLHGDDALFERLCLEGFQSGLSWLTILRKRPAFRAAFAGFAIDAVAAFTAEDEARLMADAGIVRNRAKIAAAVRNARAAQQLDEGLDALLWSFAPDPPPPRPATIAEVPATSPASVAMARELKRRGFVFVGPTTAYALMQATGMVDDHVASCFRAVTRTGPAGGRGGPAPRDTGSWGTEFDRSTDATPRPPAAGGRRRRHAWRP